MGSRTCRSVHMNDGEKPVMVWIAELNAMFNQ
jgi:hypothetical protein